MTMTSRDGVSANTRTKLGSFKLLDGQGRVRLRALPKGDALVAADVGHHLRAASIEIDELYAERGNLDDVFRQITSTEEASHA